ncbi:MAG: aldehyde dehydrogenase family protein, partial [Planctomycetota bacterium]
MSEFRATYPLYIGNMPRDTGQWLEVTDKYSNEVVSKVALAGSGEIDEAISLAFEAREAMRCLPHHRRQGILYHLVDRIRERQDELAMALCVEAGKPIRDSRGEITRLIDTLRIAGEEAVRQNGELMPLDIAPRSEGYAAIWKRVPIGVCGFITPFNFPMNLVAHKVGPAIAAGCPFVLKPASATPISALILGEILAESDLPPGAFSILPARGRDIDPLITDDRVAMISFTGSPEVGYEIRNRAHRKRVSLELGGNAACIVDARVNLDYAAERITTGAFYQSGQSCISVQRVYAHEAIYEELRDRLVKRARELKMGDPKDESTFLGPLITEDDAQRVEQWIQQAVDRGATVLCGGSRQKSLLDATWVEGVDETLPLSCREAFGPVATIAPVRSVEEAICRANMSDYGLQAGIFTNNWTLAWQAFEEIEAGGVVINDMPSFRVDSMPYGGMKQSG